MEKLRRVLFVLVTIWVSVVSCFPSNREIPCNTDEYPYQDLCCQKCPAGTYVADHCTENHQPSSCKSCILGRDFTISASGIEQCVSCLVCRQDEVLVRPCTLTSDAICQCQPGTYCNPEGTCEICKKCSRCGKGQRVKEQCNATKNTVCEDIPITQPTSNTTVTNLLPPTSTKSITMTPEKNVTKYNSTHEKDVTKDPDPGNEEVSAFNPFIPVIVILSLALCGCGFYLLYQRKEKQNHTNNQNLLTNNSADPSTNSSLSSLPLADRTNQGVAEPRMEAAPLLMCNDVADHSNSAIGYSSTQGAISPEDPGPSGDRDRGGGGRGATNNNEPCSECDLLPPCNCYWTSCFHCIINACPRYIVRIVRELGVPDNKIDLIFKDFPNDSYEQYYQMLQLWRTMAGKQASMEKVLRVLTNLEMSGLAENIKNSIRCKNIII